MESGGSSTLHNIRYKYSRRPKSGTNAQAIQEPNAVTNNMAADDSNQNPQQSFKRDPDEYMPISNVIRIMRRILLPHAKIADDAKETVQECVSEFISFITTEANDKCHREYRKTVTPEDMLSAMGSLGFDNYVETLTVYINKYRAQDPECAPTKTVPYVRLTPSFVQRPVARMAQPPAPPVPAMTMGYAPLPHKYATDEGNYTDLRQMADYFIGNQGGGVGSSSETHEFDPFK